MTTAIVLILLTTVVALAIVALSIPSKLSLIINITRWFLYVAAAVLIVIALNSRCSRKEQKSKLNPPSTTTSIPSTESNFEAGSTATIAQERGATGGGPVAAVGTNGGAAAEGVGAAAEGVGAAAEMNSRKGGDSTATIAGDRAAKRRVVRHRSEESKLKSLPPLQPRNLPKGDTFEFPITHSSENFRMNLLVVTIGCQFKTHVWRRRYGLTDKIITLNFPCGEYSANQYRLGNEFKQGDILIIEWRPNIIVKEVDNHIEIPRISLIDNRSNDPAPIYGSRIRW